MDCRDSFSDPINPLPVKCPRCGFPDLDHVPRPYFLVKSRAMTPNELAVAAVGNFFVRERVRRVFDLVIPGICTFYPTCYRGTTQVTPWSLVVPAHQLVTARVKPSIRRCEACGEPRSAHPGSQWSEYLFGKAPGKVPPREGWGGESDYDVFKSATWGSSELGWDQWITRSFFLSVRLLHLLKQIKAKGFYQALFDKSLAPNEDEAAWVREKLRIFKAGGVPLHPDGTLSDDDAKWFRGYLKSRARGVESSWDVKAVERRLKTKLPKSYVDFVSKVGPTSFENVDAEEGFTATILPPPELEFEGLAEECEDEDSKAVNALTFATTAHGDCFCFDVQKGKKEYPVVLFKHEGFFFEPYAENFVACVKRFACANEG
jgi:SMI1 / KNR4 family (SUKH-1)